MEKDDIKDLAWYNEKGQEFIASDWNNAKTKSISYMVYSEHSLLLTIFNAENSDKKWKLPNVKKAKKWKLVLDSSETLGDDIKLGSSKLINVPAWSVLAIEINI